MSDFLRKVDKIQCRHTVDSFYSLSAGIKDFTDRIRILEEAYKSLREDVGYPNPNKLYRNLLGPKKEIE